MAVYPCTHLGHVPDPMEALWRYMDIYKFLDLVTTQELHFAQLHVVVDPYEGREPDAVALRRLQTSQLTPEEAWEQSEEMRLHFRRWTFVSCWHRSDCESEAMWRLYGLLDKGSTIAVRSSLAAMTDALSGDPELICARSVEYKDFEALDTDHLPPGDKYQVMATTKRRSFDHEREFRLFLQFPLSLTQGWAAGVLAPPFYRSKVQLLKMIMEVVFDPLMPKWQVRLIERLARPALPETPMHQSRLLDFSPPSWVGGTEG